MKSCDFRNSIWETNVPDRSSKLKGSLDWESFFGCLRTRKGGSLEGVGGAGAGRHSSLISKSKIPKIDFHKP